ncbi:MAG TPA: tetratricopeptide repeat protein [Pirellulales bacterium]|jgi:tetratricopeptide (TPR) repeat protein|nr:tetratricopeptide repeat protein [Pirellulales bacterium]
MSFVAGTLAAAPIERNPTTPEQAPAAKRPQEVLDAIKRFEGGNPEGAFELLKAASAKNASLAPPRVMLANLFFSDRQKAAGLEQLELAVLESPDDPEPHLIFGDIAVFERRLSDAEAQFAASGPLLAKYSADAGRKASLTSQYYLGLAMVAKMRGQWGAAQKQLAILLDAQPKNSTAHRRMAEALIGAGKTDEALKELQAAVKADPSLPPAASLMAEIYRQIGNSKEVEKWLTRAVEESPHDVRARLAMGKWWLDQGELDEAAAEFAAAEKIDPSSLEVKLAVGTVARLQHDDTRAQHQFESVLEQAPGSFSASNQLALLLAEQTDSSKLRRALEMAEGNLRAAPQSGEAESTLGWIEFKLGKTDEAERHLRAAAARGSISRDTAYFIAKVEFDRGQRDESLRMLRQAVGGRGPFAYAEESKRWLAKLTKPSEAPQK